MENRSDLRSYLEETLAVQTYIPGEELDPLVAISQMAGLDTFVSHLDAEECNWETIEYFGIKPTNSWSSPENVFKQSKAFYLSKGLEHTGSIDHDTDDKGLLEQYATSFTEPAGRRLYLRVVKTGKPHPSFTVTSSYYVGE